MSARNPSLKAGQRRAALPPAIAALAGVQLNEDEYVLTNLRDAMPFADQLVEEGLFLSQRIQRATIELARRTVTDYSQYLQKLETAIDNAGAVSDAYLWTRSAEHDAAFLIGLAAGVRIAGGGQ